MTRRAGKLVVEGALESGWQVTAFVRNPSKLEPTLVEKISVIQGDLRDEESIFSAVKSSCPHAIIDASSSIPFGQAKGQPANNADRGLIGKATVRALESDGRLNDCVMIIIGGQLVPEPGGTINSWFVGTLAWLLENAVVPAMWKETKDAIHWLWNGAPPTFRFVYARLGYMVEKPSKGTLVPQPTLNNIQKGEASYCDVADALVKLAEDETRAWDRKALIFNYAK
ncbi:hypothetical protein HDU76_004607 [Blyttiomyces sp. JEL0837]|nr:hypothetical protein HDU76_004607 [Blyttiomyces sp. JEL0837]